MFCGMGFVDESYAMCRLRKSFCTYLQGAEWEMRHSRGIMANEKRNEQSPGSAVIDDEPRWQEEGRAEPCNEDTGFESHTDEDLDSGRGLKVCVERGERRGGIYEPCSREDT